MGAYDRLTPNLARLLTHRGSLLILIVKKTVEPIKFLVMIVKEPYSDIVKSNDWFGRGDIGIL